MVRKKLLFAVSLLPLPGKPNLQISPAARPSYAAARALSIQVFWYGLTDSRSRNGPLRIETQLGLAALPLGNCHENGESAHEKSKAYEQLAIFMLRGAPVRHMTPVAKSQLHSLRVLSVMVFTTA
jgi:hypothetical protein